MTINDTVQLIFEGVFCWLIQTKFKFIANYELFIANMSYLL